MRIAYIVSQYPALTETFIAREIAQLVQTGHVVTICILRPMPQRDGPLGLEGKGTVILRVSLDILSHFVAQIRAMINFPTDYLRFWGEVVVAGIRKPSRALHLIYLLVASAWFAQQLVGCNIQYIHSHFLHSEAVVTRWLGIMLHVPYGITAHVSSIRLDQYLIRRVMFDAKLLVGDTTQTLNVYRRLSGCSAHLIRNGINLDAFPFHHSTAYSHNNEFHVILAVGRLIPPKGFDVLIKACSLLRERGLAFRCRIIGEGDERPNLTRLTGALGLESIVDMPGALPFNALREQYESATLFAMPSVPSPVGSDGLPTVLIEAMALGVPVVASNYAGIPDLVRPRETGLLVEPGDPNALAECIVELLTDSGLRSRLASSGRCLVENEFDLRYNVAKLSLLIEQSVSKA